MPTRSTDGRKSARNNSELKLMNSETNQAGVFQGFQKILDTLSQEEKGALLASLTAGGQEEA